jgi:hypothetical protein
VNSAPPFTDPTLFEQTKSLADQLIPVADGIRDLYTQFGLRPYTVRIITVSWSGGDVGVGVPSVVNNLHLLPTPKIIDLGNITEIAQPVGLDEVGSVEVSEISGSYTEDQLRGLDYAGNTQTVDIDMFYEIQMLQPNAQLGAARRFQLRGAPQYLADKFQWVVRLEKSHEDRARDGTPGF